MSSSSIEIKRTDYQSMSPDALTAWVEKLSTLRGDSSAQSPEERLLVAIVADIRELNRDQFSREWQPGVVFSESKKRLIRWDDFWHNIRVSRYGMSDWNSVLTAVLQEVAVRLSGDEKRGQGWADYAQALGVSPAPVEFIFREPFGSRGTVKTPYGPLDFTFGKDSITAPDGSWTGVPIAVVKDFVDIEDSSGQVHRVRGEEIHPHSGDLTKVLPVTKRGIYADVHFGKSFVEEGGKRFYALYQISGVRVATLSADGLKSTARVMELRG